MLLEIAFCDKRQFLLRNVSIQITIFAVLNREIDGNYK